MSSSTAKMTRIQGIGLALGSMVGAGIIFLPSLLYALSGPDVLVVWGLGLLLCLPLLYMFSDLVDRVPPGRGIEGFISLGLGGWFGASVPVFFLFGVFLGVPTTFLVPGRFLQSLVGGSDAVAHGLVLFMIGVSASTTLLGLRGGTWIQNVMSATAGAVALGVFVLTVEEAVPGYGRVVPTFEHPERLLQAVMVSFFAFGGLENMSFIASDFERPKRDYVVVMCISLGLYAALLIGLTANYAAVVPRDTVDEVQGLFQLAERIEPRRAVDAVMMALAYGVCQININAWFWGMARMINGAAWAGHLPRWLGSGSPQIQLDKGVGLQVVLSLAGLVLAGLRPDLLAELFSGVSSILVALYLMVSLSYFRWMNSWPKRSLAAVTSAGLLACLIAGDAWLPALALSISALGRGARQSWS